MRLASVRASPRSWVTNSTVCRSRSQISQQRPVHLELGVGIERPEGLVHQQDLGLHDQRAHQRHALPHAAREHPRETLPSKPARPATSIARRDLRPALVARHAGDLEPVADIRLDGAPRKHGVALEDVADCAGSRRLPSPALPSMAISPPERGMRPATMLRMVLLPQPDGPRRATNSPCRMSNEMFSTAIDAALAAVDLVEVTDRNPHGSAIWAPGGTPGGFDHGRAVIRSGPAAASRKLMSTMSSNRASGMSVPSRYQTLPPRSNDALSIRPV